jgi:hypothetical protein
MPTDKMSAGRTQVYELAEQVVVSWVTLEVPAPRLLAETIRQFRILDAQVLRAKRQDEAPLLDRQNKLYDNLMAAALEKVRVSARAEAQLRRIARRAEARMTWTQKCDRAIEQFRQGVRV